MLEYIFGWLTFSAAVIAVGLMAVQGMQYELTHREDEEIYRLAQEMAEHAEVTVDARIAIIDEMADTERKDLPK